MLDNEKRMKEKGKEMQRNQRKSKEHETEMRRNEKQMKIKQNLNKVEISKKNSCF